MSREIRLAYRSFVYEMDKKLRSEIIFVQRIATAFASTLKARTIDLILSGYNAMLLLEYRKY